MNIIDVNLASGSYPVYVGQGLLRQPPLWQRHLGSGRCLVVSNSTVAPLYLDAVLEGLGDHPAETCIVPDGEQYKNQTHWARILDQLVETGARRDATVIALGGGVIGDLAGYAAASYMRGIQVIQVPTTLLAQVDASVGGKTAINHARGKNLIGAFHQPGCVFIDTSTLDSLAEREYRAGLAEVVKYGAIRDLEFFEWLERSVPAINSRLPDAVQKMIETSVTQKAEVVAADEQERGERALLNFGHTFAHALETATGYEKYLHGEAVAIGMVMAARLSENTGHASHGLAQRLVRLLQRLGLDTDGPSEIAPSDLLSIARLDKKNRDRHLRTIQLEAIGRAVIDENTPADAFLAAIPTPESAI